MPHPLKNGAPSPIHVVDGGSRQAESPDVEAAGRPLCDLVPSAPSTAKWRFGPSKKRHLSPFPANSLTIISGFFTELGHQGEICRESDSEKGDFPPVTTSSRTGTDILPKGQRRMPDVSRGIGRSPSLARRVNMLDDTDLLERHAAHRVATGSVRLWRSRQNAVVLNKTLFGNTSILRKDRYAN